MTGRILAAAALVVALAAALGGLQELFDGADARRGVTKVLAHRGAPGGRSVLEALEALGEGPPRCEARVVSRLFADVQVGCASPRRPEVLYLFRVRLDAGRPRGESDAARALLASLEGEARGESDRRGPTLGIYRRASGAAAAARAAARRRIPRRMYA